MLNWWNALLAEFNAAGFDELCCEIYLNKICRTSDLEQLLKDFFSDLNFSFSERDGQVLTCSIRINHTYMDGLGLIYVLGKLHDCLLSFSDRSPRIHEDYYQKRLDVAETQALKMKAAKANQTLFSYLAGQLGLGRYFVSPIDLRPLLGLSVSDSVQGNFQIPYLLKTRSVLEQLSEIFENPVRYEFLTHFSPQFIGFFATKISVPMSVYTHLGEIPFSTECFYVRFFQKSRFRTVITSFIQDGQLFFN